VSPQTNPRQAPAPGNAQRNALVPGFIALATLVFGTALIGTELFTIVRFLISILALIVVWFAVQARQWWWIPLFIGVAVLWNPVVPLPFTGIFWVLAQPLAGSFFVLAGILIRQERSQRT